MYQVRAMNLRDLADFSTHNYAPVDRAFQDALSIIAPEDEIHTHGMGMYIRFHYAAMLAQMYGEQRERDIVWLLSSITESPTKFPDYPFPFYTFLRTEVGHDHDKHGHKKEIIRLTDFSPEFRAFVVDYLHITY